MKIRDKYMQYVGCPTFIDPKTGFLVIAQHGKVMSQSTDFDYSHGMFVGIERGRGRRRCLHCVVMFGGGNLSMFDRKYTKII